MHYRLEIIMPPTDDVKTAVSEIMSEFNQTNDDSSHGFWDWYVIGGRFAGAKTLAKCDQEKLDAFQTVLQERKVTVAGLTAGKQEISPADQIPMVDALWKEHFPEFVGDSCPLFKHSNNQYDDSDLIDGDICTFAEIPPSLTAERVMFAVVNSDTKEFECSFMLSRDFWNGANYQKAEWNGLLADAVETFTDKIKNYCDEYRAARLPSDDWLVVTVDYHT